MRGVAVELIDEIQLSLFVDDALVDAGQHKYNRHGVKGACGWVDILHLSVLRCLDY